MPVRPSGPMVEDSHASRGGPRGYRGSHRGWRLSNARSRWAMVKARPAFCSTSATPEVTSRAPSRRRSFRSRSWAPVCRSPTPADGLSLRRTGRVGTPGTLGLGGWSVNVLQGYGASQGASWAGTARGGSLEEVPAGPGEVAVPSYDGTLAYVFNAAGRQVRTVDGRLGTTLLSFAYDPEGRLSQVSGTLNGSPVHLSVRRGADGRQLALVGTDGGSTSLTLDSRGDLVALRGRRAGRPSSPGNPVGRSPPRPTPAVPSPASATAPTGCSYPRPTLTE